MTLTPTTRPDLILALAAAAALTAPFAPPALAQCTPGIEQLLSVSLGVRIGPPDGSRGTVYATTAWDPDGAGPEPEWFVIGGDFDYVNGVEAHGAAAWDGTRWRSFGLPDMPPSKAIKVLAVHQGHLIAAGEIWDIAGSVVGHMFELTSDGWRLFEGRRGPGIGPGDESITCVLSNGDDLYIAGKGVVAEGSTSTQIVRWDGMAYRHMGISLGLHEQIDAMTMHNGELHITGRFRGFPHNSLRFVARYDGASWHQVGEGLDEEGISIFSDNDRLYVGFFPSDVDEPNAMVWDGVTWEPIGVSLGDGPDLRDWTLHDGEIVACGGWIDYALNTYAELGVWRLIGNVWTPLQVAGFMTGDSGSAKTWSLQHWRGDLVASGGRHKPTMSRNIGGIARLHEKTWTPLDFSLDGSIRSLLPLDGSLLATGFFTSAGGVFSPGACILTNDGVESLDAPVRFEMHDHRIVREATTWNDRLYLLGDFLTDDPSSTGVLMRDPDGTWSPVPHPFPWFDAWQAVVLDDTLYVTSNTAGLNKARGLVALDQSGTWATIVSSDSSAQLYAAIVHDGELHVSGSFTTLEGLPIAGVARYDGSTWHSLGMGLFASVYDLVEHNGSLWAAGDFTITETGVAATLARWDGSNWHAVPTPTSNRIAYVRSAGGRLYISDEDRDAYVWNAGRWTPLLFGTSNRGFADVAEVDGRTVVVGGTRLIGTEECFVPFALSLSCPTDYICDGVTDIVDFLDFIQAHADCSDALPACDPIRADFNQDGLVDVLDVMDFIDRMSEGC
jgi:hypothetical protein